MVFTTAYSVVGASVIIRRQGSIIHSADVNLAVKSTPSPRHEVLSHATLNAVPTYASACSGTVGYSSACLCIGATKATITLSVPVGLSFPSYCIFLWMDAVLDHNGSHYHVPKYSDSDDNFSHHQTASQ